MLWIDATIAQWNTQTYSYIDSDNLTDILPFKVRKQFRVYTTIFYNFMNFLKKENNCAAKILIWP